MCPCSLVTHQTDNEPLFCLVGTTWIRPLRKTKVHYLCGVSQGNKGTCHKGTAYGYRALDARLGWLLINKVFLVTIGPRYILHKVAHWKQCILWEGHGSFSGSGVLLVINHTNNVRFELTFIKVCFISKQLTWPLLVQNIPLEAMHCGKCIISSLGSRYTWSD